MLSVFIPIELRAYLHSAKGFAIVDQLTGTSLPPRID